MKPIKQRKSLVTAPTVCKGDVIWVPYRRDPNWPALVQNVYDKKLTYVFFPLPRTNVKGATFRCLRSNVYALSTTDSLSSNATKELKEAFEQACSYLRGKGLEVGSSIARRPFFDSSEGSNYSSVIDELVESGRPEDPESSSNESSNLSDVKGNVEEEESIKKGTLSSERKRNRRTSSHSKSEQKKIKLIYADSTTTDHSLKGEFASPVQKQNEERVPTENVVPDDTAEVALIDASAIANNLLMNPTQIMQLYTAPPRKQMKIQIHALDLFTDAETDTLVNRCMDAVRSHKPEYSYLVALHFTLQCIVPEVIRHALMKARKISFEEASSILNGTEKKPSTDFTEQTPNGLAFEELVRIACREKEMLESK